MEDEYQPGNSFQEPPVQSSNNADPRSVHLEVNPGTPGLKNLENFAPVQKPASDGTWGQVYTNEERKNIQKKEAREKANKLSDNPANNPFADASRGERRNEMDETEQKCCLIVLCAAIFSSMFCCCGGS